MRQFGARSAAILLLAFLGLGAGGCTALLDRTTIHPHDGRFTVELQPEQIIDLMRQSGFTDEEIVNLGTDLRNALAIRGGAKIRVDDEYTRAIFLAEDGYVYVVVRGGKDVYFRIEEPKEALPEKTPPRTTSRRS